MFAVRYVKNSDPVERFLQFIPVSSHGAENLADVIKFFAGQWNPAVGLQGTNVRQRVEHACWTYSGPQARLRAVNPVAVFVPCAFAEFGRCKVC